MPRPGWRTDFALFSSYSVNLVAVAAVAIALAGEGDDDEHMWKGSLARACEKMRDKFRVVCQAGRITVPPPGAVSGLVVADRWVRQVAYDGNKRSWHAKLGIVRYVREHLDDDASAEWLLWIGSRNLTRDTSWDSALTATGRVGPVVNEVDTSVRDAVSIVAQHGELPRWKEALHQELGKVHWSWPAEIKEVVEFCFWTDSTFSMGLPDLPTDSSRIVAVSPFVHASVAKAIAGATEAPQRSLLTTPGTVAELAHHPAALEGFTDLHLMDSATPAEDAEADQDETGDEQMIEIHRGLHAKLVWARSPRGDDLWLGSANLTRRGWWGSNAELVAHLRVNASVGDDLANLVDNLEDIALEDISVHESDAHDELLQELDRLRNGIAGSWSGELRRVNGTRAWRCKTPTPPIAQEDNAQLSARLLGQDAAKAVVWEPGQNEIDLGETESHEQTELVVLELQSKADTSTSVSWVERAVMHPPPSVERDRDALGRLMGPRAMLTWIRSILDEFSEEGADSSWPERHDPRSPSRTGGRPTAAPVPTLEAILRTWIRNPDSVRKADHVLRTWAKAAKPVVDDDLEAASELNRFQEVWEVVRDGLDAKGS